MINDFYGAKIQCATYAFINLTKDAEIDPDLFEISTSVPFGTVHRRYPKYDHLLTPYCTPEQGFDDAIRLWGYDLEKKICRSPEEAVRFLKTYLPKKEGAVLGPVDMGRLFYMPFTNLYHGLDHYIVVRICGGEQVEIVDSEGTMGQVLTYEQLEKSISIKGVPEACGRIGIRMARKKGPIHWRKIIRESMIKAAVNFKACQQERDGKYAFRDCMEYITGVPTSRWKLALMYDLGYLMQRKILSRKLVDAAAAEGYVSEKLKNTSVELTDRQLKLLGEAFFQLRQEECIKDELIESLMDSESSLSKASCQAAESMIRIA